MGEEERRHLRLAIVREVRVSFSDPEVFEEDSRRSEPRVPDDERFMKRALELAATPVFTSPNPRVGAVIVRDGRILGEGFHEGPGRPHAEAVALEGIDARGATCYVTLEPCNHHGRKPPCAPAIVTAGVERVVAAVQDPDPRVDGRGFQYLRSHGVEVDVGVLQEEARAGNAPFFHQRTTGRALLTLKLALTLDGRLAAPDGSSRWITGEAARKSVHVRRAGADAVMVGSGTVAADDPSLTARGVAAQRQPARVIVDSSGTVRGTARVFAPDAEVIVATTDRAPHECHVEWKEAGADVLVLPHGTDGVDERALIDALSSRGWLEIYCEGGARLATRLLRADVIDRLELYHGAVLAGRGGPDLGDIGVRTLDEAPRFLLRSTEVLGDDVLTVFMRRGA